MGGLEHMGTQIQSPDFGNFWLEGVQLSAQVCHYGFPRRGNFFIILVWVEQVC